MGNAKIEAKWAIIMAIVLHLLAWVSKFLGWQTVEKFGTHEIVMLVSFIVAMVLGYFLCIKEKRNKDLDGLMTYGQGFWTGGILTLLLTVFSSLLVYAYVNWCSPDFIGTLAAHEIAHGEMEEGATIAKSTFLQMHVIWMVVCGLVLSLLMPLFLKKKAE